MDLEARKLSIIEKFIQLQNIEILSEVENLLAKVKGKNKNDVFQPMSIDEFNKRIDKSMDDSKNGKLISNDELISEIEKWD